MSCRADFEIPGSLDRVQLIGELRFRHVETFARYADTAAPDVSGTMILQLGQDPLDETLALKEPDLGLDIGEGRGAVSFGNRRDLLDVEKILVEILYFQRGARLVDRRLRQRQENAGEGSKERDQDEDPLVAAQDSPVFE